jgi:hypothetical protein
MEKDKNAAGIMAAGKSLSPGFLNPCPLNPEGGL